MKPKPAAKKSLNIRQERFAEFVVSGLSATESYKRAGYSSKGKSAESNAFTLSENHGVKARIAELRAKTARKFELSREKLALHLLGAVMTPSSEITADSPYSSEYTEEVLSGSKRGSGRDTVLKRRVKGMEKNAAARLLCEMMGWKEPEQMVVETGPKTLESLEARAREVASALDRRSRN